MDNEFSPDRSTVGPPLIRDGLKDMQKIFELEAEKTDLLSAGEALLDWARSELMWQPIETAPKDGTEFYAAQLNEYPSTVYYQTPSEGHPDHIWMDDREKSAFHREAFDVWRPIDAPRSPGKLPDPLEAFAEALKRVRGE